MRQSGPGPLAPGQPRDVLVEEVRHALGGISEGAGVLVALSGGPDSTALAYLASEARPDLEIVLGHVRHGLRDDERDVEVVRTHASFLGAPLRIVEVEVEPTGEGPEAAARTERYAALRRMANEAGADWILVGHTADDQAETVLLRLARGTGVPGLGAMAPVRGDLVRPLLRLRREDIRTFVKEEGVPTAQDPMNRDPAVRRIRARQEVLPAFERLGPDPVGALARLADLARDDARLLADQAAEVTSRVSRSVGPVTVVAWDDLAVLPDALRARVVRRIVMASRPEHEPPSAAQVSSVLDLPPGAAVDLPGVSATSGGGWLAVGPSDVPAPAPRTLPVPGRTAWPPLGIELLASTGEDDPATGGQLSLPVPEARLAVRPVAEHLLPPGADPALGEVVLGLPPCPDAPSPSPPRSFEVRRRRDGDRMQLRAGTRKLQDILVDAGVPRLLRDLIPVVTFEERIVWIPGIAVDAELAADGRARFRVLLGVRPH